MFGVQKNEEGGKDMEPRKKEKQSWVAVSDSWSSTSVSIMQLVYVNNVHICENAVIKRKHRVEIADEYHLTSQEFNLWWRRHFLQSGDGL